MYSIKLTDGTELQNLELNGNNFISDTVIGDEVFNGNLETVVITDENGSTEYHNVKLVQNKVHGMQSWFILAEKSSEEIEKENLYQLLADLTEVVLMEGGE